MIRNPFRLAGEREKITRRVFGAKLKRLAVLFGAGMATRKPGPCAVEPAFSIIVAPDTQYLAANCGSGFDGLANWTLANQASAASGALVTNFKMWVGVGDCVNDNDASQMNRAAHAYGILTSNSFPWITPPGNHDMTNADPSTRAMNPQWNAGGFFASDTRQTNFGSGINCPGTGGGVVTFGGSIGGVADPCNYWVKLVIGSRRIILFCLEYQPATPTLAWAKSVHDANTDCECIVVTHSYLTDMGGYAQMPGDPDYNAQTADNGTLNQTSGLASGGNSGYKQWTNALTTWSRLAMVICGHYFYGGNTFGPYPSWYWQQVAAVSTSSRGQTVQQIQANFQQEDLLVGSCDDGTSDRQHLFILKWPGNGTVEGYNLSVNTGKWGGQLNAAPAVSPVRLFSVPYAGLSDVPTTAISGQAVMSGPVVLR